MIRGCLRFLIAAPVLAGVMGFGLTCLNHTALASETNQARRGLVYVGGFMTQSGHYQHHLDTLGEYFDEVVFVPSGQSALSPDHFADFARIEQAFLNLQESGMNEIFAVGYSLGGKMVARLALHEELSGLALLDPVDGGVDSGPGGKTPAFLTDADEITAQTLILWSEHGQKPKLFGKACVTPGMGAQHFLNHIRSDAVYRAQELRGASHLSFLAKPWNPMMRLACDNGTRQHDEIAQEIEDILVSFLRQH
jgi:hypothetical protein